jgi:hypothetical protein
MKLLRQSTSTIITVGPILGTDFLTVQTGVSLSTGHAEMYPAGSAIATDISGRTWAHISGGIYQLTLTSGDLGTLGPLLIHIHAASTQPLAVHCNVLAQAAYDTLCGGGALPANMQQVNGSASSAANLGAAAQGITSLTVGAGSSTNLISTNLASAVSGFYTGRTLVFTSGLLAGQAAQITAYNGATKQLSVSQLTGAPSVNDTAVIV